MVVNNLFVKRILAIFFLCVVLLTVVLLGLFCDKSDENYVRIHIVANSSNVSDERAKEQVGEEMKSFLAPIFLSSKDDVISYLRKNLKNICGIANEILAQNNLDYESSAELSCRFFGEETLSGTTFREGNYQLLVLVLGEGIGNIDGFVCECGGTSSVFESRFF